MLFDLDNERVHGNRSVESKGLTDFVNGASIKLFKEFLSDMERECHYHFWTGGQWYMHELLAYLLSITGRADVCMCTWAISEDPVRALIRMKENDLIGKLDVVFDYKVKDQKSNSFLLASQNFDRVVLSKVHAKVLCIVNDGWAISVSGSANWTRNPRAERQLLCTVRDVVLNDVGVINDLLDGNDVFKVKK